MADIKFLYEVIRTGILDDAVVEVTFQKTTTGTPLSKTVLLPPSEGYDISFSYDGVTFGDWLEIRPDTPFRLPAVARKARLRASLASLNNQELIKDGMAGDFDAAKDSLHDIRAYLESAIGAVSVAVTGSHTITVVHGITEQTIAFITPTRNLAFEAYFDVNTLITAGEGGLVRFRLKTQIDNTNLRTIDLSSFLIGTDEIHPVLEGFSDIGANTMSLTVQCSIAVSANRIIPYRIQGGIL